MTACFLMILGDTGVRFALVEVLQLTSSSLFDFHFARMPVAG